MALLLILSSLTPLQTSAADDLTGHRYEDYMRELVELGIIKGYSDGSYQPNRDVTRAEFAKMIVSALELVAAEPAAGENAAETADVPAFTDVSSKAWYAEAVRIAVEAGVVRGYEDNTFRPNTKITREQMATMVNNAMEAKGIIINPENLEELKFTDTPEILSIHRPDVNVLTNLKIINGNTDNTFRPKGSSTRWMVAIVILKSRDQVFPPKEMPFKASSVNAEGTTPVKEFETFDEALAYAKATNNVSVIESSNKVVWMKEGIAVSNTLASVYPTTELKWLNTSPGNKFRPYVTLNTELKYLEATSDYVKVELAGKAGYVKTTDVTLVPKPMMKGQSYYEVIGVNLVHWIFNANKGTNGSYASTGVIGAAPEGLVAKAKYYSWDGTTFTDANGKLVTEAYQYYNQLPLRTTTSYTAEQLDKYLADAFPFYNKTAYEKYWTSSPLVGTGADFKEVEAKYNVNALYLMAHAIHESAWGTSKIAQLKNNLFGYGAYDKDPVNGAYSYNNFKESIDFAAKTVNANYHNVSGSYYNGSILGNKALGMNVRYASDPYWGEKIAAHMYRADKHLAGSDSYRYELGYTNEPALNFRAAAGTSGELLYTMPNMTKLPVVINGQTNVSGSIWYKVMSEDNRFTEAYGYGTGSLGEFIKLMPIAK